jgi:molecular chaperone DnaK
LLTQKETTRLFRATRRAENPVLIGIVVLVGATLAHYLLRAAQRISKADAKKEKSGGKATVHDDDDDDDEEADAADGKAGTGASTSKRGFPVLGLDLGSLQACVTYVASKETAPLVVENHEGRRSTPSYIAFEEGHLVVGQLARRARWRAPASVAFNIQRLLGETTYDDKLRPLFPFPVEASLTSDKNQPPIAMLLKGGRSLTPIEASSRLLEDLVATAEHKLPHTPGFAVLAIPSYFGAQAKSWALKAVADGTGLEVGQEEVGHGGGVEVVEDAVAALVCAHYSGAISQKEAFLGKPWLVVDVGGLNAQVSIVGLDPEQGLGVRGNRVSWAVGGEQVDGVLVQWLVEDFKKKNGGLDLGMDYMALERLYEAAEATKQELSSKVSSNVRLPFITADHRGPKHLEATVSRALLEKLASPILTQLEGPFREVLKEAGMEVGDLEGVLLSGGSTRLPFVGEFVKGSLLGGGGEGGKEGGVKVVVLEEVPPEEMVAVGAGYYGRTLMD